MNRPLLVIAFGGLSLLFLIITISVDSQTQAAPGFTQGNVDCKAGIDGVDALEIATFAAGVTPSGPAPGCPVIGSSMVGGHLWGDLNCDNNVTIDDAILPLKYVAGLPVPHADNCVDVGQQIGGPTVTPSPSPTPSATPYACNVFGWTVAKGSSTWSCQAATSISVHISDGDHILLSNQTLTNTHIEANVSTTNREASLVLRAQDGNNAYVALFVPDGTPFPSGVAFYKIVGGTYVALASAPLSSPVHTGEVAKLEAEMVGTHITIKVNGTTLLDLHDSTYASGKVGLRAYGDTNANCDSTWANIAFHEVV